VNKPVDQHEWLRAMAEKVETDGPQTVPVEGHDALTVLTAVQYRLLAERKPTFKEWLLTGPKSDDVVIESDPRPSRDFSF